MSFKQQLTHLSHNAYSNMGAHVFFQLFLKHFAGKDPLVPMAGRQGTLFLTAGNDLFYSPWLDMIFQSQWQAKTLCSQRHAENPSFSR